MAARHLRTVIGTFVIAVVLAAFLVQHVFATEDYNWRELASNGALLLVGLLLVDRSTGMEVLSAVKEKLPLVGKPK